MDGYKDFTNDPYRFPTDKFRKFLDDLHNNSQHYVPIFDAAIYVPNPNNATDDDYEPFHLGNESDVFLKNPDGSLYIGAVWPGYTVFPDFLANNTQEYWNKMFKDWYERIPFDGIWTDMNEVSSFCVGSCGTDRYFDNPVHPPFEVGYSGSDYPLGFDKSNASEWKSISEAAAATKTTTTTSSSASTSIDGKNTLAPGKVISIIHHMQLTMTKVIMILPHTQFLQMLLMPMGLLNTIFIIYMVSFKNVPFTKHY